MALLCSWGFTPVEDAERAGHSVVAAFLRGSAAQTTSKDLGCGTVDERVIAINDEAPLSASAQAGSNYGSLSGLYAPHTEGMHSMSADRYTCVQAPCSSQNNVVFVVSGDMAVHSQWTQMQPPVVTTKQSEGKKPEGVVCFHFDF